MSDSNITFNEILELKNKLIELLNKIIENNNSINTCLEKILQNQIFEIYQTYLKDFFKKHNEDLENNQSKLKNIVSFYSDSIQKFCTNAESIENYFTKTQKKRIDSISDSIKKINVDDI